SLYKLCEVLFFNSSVILITREKGCSRCSRKVFKLSSIFFFDRQRTAIAISPFSFLMSLGWSLYSCFWALEEMMLSIPKWSSLQENPFFATVSIDFLVAISLIEMFFTKLNDICNGKYPR